MPPLLAVVLGCGVPPQPCCGAVVLGCGVPPHFLFLFFFAMICVVIVGVGCLQPCGD